jgi:hypothetical protein
VIYSGSHGLLQAKYHPNEVRAVLSNRIRQI